VHEGLDLGERDLGRVVLEDDGLGLEDLAERPQRDAVAVGEAAADDDLGLHLERGDQLAHEAALAHAGVPCDRGQVRRALVPDTGEEGAQDLELAVPAHHRRLKAGDAARLGYLALALDDPCCDRIPLPLEVECVERPQLEDALDGLRGPLSEDDRARLGRLLQARGDVDRVARDEEVAARRAGGQHLAGAHADADADRLGLGPAHVPALQAPEHAAGGAHGPQRVVFMGRRHAEDGHDRVADELLDRAALRRDLLGHCREVVGHHRPHVLGVHLLCARRRADNVREEHGDELEHLAGRGFLRCRPTGGAEAGSRGKRFAAARTGVHVGEDKGRPAFRRRPTSRNGHGSGTVPGTWLGDSPWDMAEADADERF
jgi:hypothetical protein